MARKSSVLNRRLVIVLLLVVICGVGMGVHVASTSQISFDATAWREATRRNYFRPRYRMANDLSGQIREWSPEPGIIVNVLGPPSHTNFDDNTEKTTGEAIFMRYPLGRNQRALLSLSQYYLLIKYNENGQLQGVTIHPE